MKDIEPLNFDPSHVELDAGLHLKGLAHHINDEQWSHREAGIANNPAEKLYNQFYELANPGTAWKREGNSLELKSQEGLPVSRITTNQKGDVESITLYTPNGMSYVESYDTSNHRLKEQTIHSRSGTEYTSFDDGNRITERYYRDQIVISQKRGEEEKLAKVTDAGKETSGEQALESYISFMLGEDAKQRLVGK